ncbi:MAG: hypothetical protein R3D67_08945 [Hyphomicrobiaceae bacterium]
MNPSYKPDGDIVWLKAPRHRPLVSSPVLHDLEAMLPDHIKFLAMNALVGIAAGCTVASLMIWADAGGLGTLIFETGSPAIAVGLLFGGFSVTFGSLAVGSAIMLLHPKD